MSKKNREILLALFITVVALLVFSWLDPIDSDTEWSGDVDFSFTTSTPKIDLMAEAEGGWWDEIATQKPATLPPMLDIELLDATATPLSATQTALALTPSITPTRTPLFDVNATESTPLFDVNATKTPTSIPKKDE